MLEIFKKQPYLNVPLPPELQSKLHVAVQRWKDFCTLPDEFKKKFELRKYDTDWADPGYRDKKANPGDKKELYHYTLGQEHLLFVEGLQRDAYSNTRALEFFGIADEILRDLTPILLKVRKDIGFDESVLREQMRFATLRFLNYVSRGHGTEIADTHFDYSGLTLHLWPNHDNEELEYLEGGVWKKFKSRRSKVSLFPGFQTMYATGGMVDPLIHRAVQEQVGQRVAMVLFIPFLFCERYQKRDANGHQIDQRVWAREHGKGYLFDQRQVESVAV